MKRKGYVYKKTLLAFLPNVKPFEPVLLKDYREALGAPFKLTLAITVLATLIIIGLGPSLSPILTIFATMRLIIQFYACITDLYWIFKTCSLPENLWVAEYKNDVYIYSRKEEALEMLRKLELSNQPPLSYPTRE
ncbi:hypothetical protein SAMN00808754_1439 [Thermanaeromonas toyohensis ToBE]|uniref:TcpE family protein n=1 Tax=Thermanaeromonas toyohensis ToBE TaxID=698762 RepID=A0A1W1VSG2_9FIRM|nr:hypothetical protein [Thermanaeromonas toyohensis]SMB96276.1 hypothetical protein SAMN00808754_1439 [Thermanaeromonas toyohensis ToBE]